MSDDEFVESHDDEHGDTGYDHGEGEFALVQGGRVEFR